MISDDDLHRLAVFLGSCAMMMIVLYHFLEVNSKDDSLPAGSGKSKKTATATASSTDGGVSSGKEK
ncbi:hypothetical protein P170DRAFT_440728 [Aspergillus steynii IBT 23096]|uniref:Dolichyl-diphosphooligosaccharide--protein glycosyltransferase subunit 4 n=1 Tax=Aspergillus steynii IBT 23096 TaxID=1392250 RepID=A0A2I2FV50_9EURO|nr:uncharacterized protein P170DRAFT_440728 [Aspergillus steynii IBT 23096]PLB44446.1 hypothetical protein P170DRAFT_440728 [Aspergillus steynii IBT 23096]